MTVDRYSLGQRLLHWSIALLVISMLVGGWIMDEFKAKDLPDGLYEQIYGLHKTFGVVILALMGARVGMRLIHGSPPTVATLATWQKRSAGFVHFAFYALLIVQPLLGMIGTWAYPAPIPMFGFGDLPNPIGKDRELSETLFLLHEIIGKVLAALAAIHIAAAISHIWQKDGVGSRMGFGG